jgi:hypothetical protein
MHLRLLCGQLSVLLIRGGILLKIAITFLFLFLIMIAWWLCLYEGQILAKDRLTFQIKKLAAKRVVLSEVLSEYRELKNSLSLVEKKHSNLDNCDYDGCQFIVKKSSIAGLGLYSYVKKPTKGQFKQMTFGFFGGYSELLFFLKSLDYKKTHLGCRRLKISRNGYKLQITYVCGIHTFIKA